MNNKKSKHSGPKKKNTKVQKGFFTRIKDWFKGLSKWKKTLVVSLLSLILILAILIGVLAGVLADMLKDYQHEELDDPDIEKIEKIEDNITNIALFGIDTRDINSFSGNSDSIMILSINESTGDIKIISVMRDSLVKIPGMQENKINAAYAYGGPVLAIKTLNENFGLDIKEYATVNFFGMEDIINAVGGLEIDVQQHELNCERGLNPLIEEQSRHRGVKPQYVAKAGRQTLNGMQAVAWARIRYAATAAGVSDDYGRTDRQRYVMEQLLNKALATDYSQYPKLVKALLPYMQTSLSFSEIIELSGILTKNITFEQTRIPQQSYVMAGPRINRIGSYVYYNLDFAEKIIHSVIYDGITQEDYLKQNKPVLKGWYTGPISPAPAPTPSSESTTTDATPDDSNLEGGGQADVSTEETVTTPAE